VAFETAIASALDMLTADLPGGPYPLVAEEDAQDHVVMALHLTNAGRAFMDDLSERAEVLREEMLEGISDKEIECTVKVFHKILENAEKQK